MSTCYDRSGAEQLQKLQKRKAKLKLRQRFASLHIASMRAPAVLLEELQVGQSLTGLLQLPLVRHPAMT